MLGLARYDDSDQEEDRMSSATNIHNDSTLKPAIGISSDTRKSSKAPVKIRRPPRSLAHPRTNYDEVIKQPEQKNSRTTTIQSREQITPQSPPVQPEGQDEMGEIRAFLFPPPIPGVPNWGINPPSTTPPNEQLQAKLAEFYRLKHDPDHPRHFNDELMSNRTFRNPHLYAKLVEHVDVDERTTNFPLDVWNPQDVQPEWFADQIAERQKAAYERQSQGQGSSKRGRIDFAPSKSSKSSHERDMASSSRSGGLSYGGYENKKTKWR